jgi:hypothetical protein
MKTCGRGRLLRGKSEPHPRRIVFRPLRARAKKSQCLAFRAGPLLAPAAQRGVELRHAAEREPWRLIGARQ